MHGAGGGLLANEQREDVKITMPDWKTNMLHFGCG
jgi:hypothetical protein